MEATTREDGSEINTAVLDQSGRPELNLIASGALIEPRSMLTSDGIYWMLSSALRNFAQMPALPLIFAALLGIGLAEKFGFFSA